MFANWTNDLGPGAAGHQLKWESDMSLNQMTLEDADLLHLLQALKLWVYGQGWNKISLECKECGEKAEHMEPVFLIDLDLAGSSLQARCSELFSFEHVWLSCLLESGVHRRIQQAGNGWWRQAQQSHEQWFVCVSHLYRCKTSIPFT